MSDFEWILHQQEGQFFEWKSCFDSSQDKVKLRPMRAEARDMAAII
ncbi:MAG: hypothetical protein Q7U03_01755 [Syntrophales bacterium]|nr:hypothetical protein [Syntrophales bacterium]